MTVTSALQYNNGMKMSHLACRSFHIFTTSSATVGLYIRQRTDLCLCLVSRPLCFSDTCWLVVVLALVILLTVC